MPSPPSVSVLLPVRDAAATLDACLASVERQSRTDFECVLVDDGSRDGGAERMRSLSGRDPRFRLITTGREGIVAALNRGIESCRAPIVARMDADDLMHRHRLAAQLAALESDPSLDAVGAHVRLFPRAALGEGMRAYERWLASIDSVRRVREEAFVECPLAHPTLTIRRDALTRFGYRDAGWPEDYDLVLRLLASGHRLGVVPRRLLAWRQGSARLSQTSAVYTAERFTACRADHLVRGPLARHERYLLWGHGGTGRALRRALTEHGRHPAAIVELHPGRLGQTIHGAPVIAPNALGPPGRLPLLVSVAGALARGRIRRELTRFGWRECVDYVCAA